MAARLIHFGPDDCHRHMVLRSAGYLVEDCASLSQLRSALLPGSAPDALLVSDCQNPEPEEAVSLARTLCSIPIILFRSSNFAHQDSRFDLIVPPLTPPEVWLTEVDIVITRSRSIRAHSGFSDEGVRLRRA